MVNVTKGILVECDPAMKQVMVHAHLHLQSIFLILQFLLHLDEKFTLGSKFIIQVRGSWPYMYLNFTLFSRTLI